MRGTINLADVARYIIHFCGGDQLTIDEKKAKKLAEFLKQNQAKNFNK